MPISCTFASCILESQWGTPNEQDGLCPKSEHLTRWYNENKLSRVSSWRVLKPFENKHCRVSWNNSHRHLSCYFKPHWRLGEFLRSDPATAEAHNHCAPLWTGSTLSPGRLWASVLREVKQTHSYCLYVSACISGARNSAPKMPVVTQMWRLAISC